MCSGYPTTYWNGVILAAADTTAASAHCKPSTLARVTMNPLFSELPAPDSPGNTSETLGTASYVFQLDPDFRVTFNRTTDVSVELLGQAQSASTSTPVVSTSTPAGTDPGRVIFPPSIPLPAWEALFGRYPSVLPL